MSTNKWPAEFRDLIPEGVFVLARYVLGKMPSGNLSIVEIIMPLKTYGRVNCF
jgi:hypothetical protein